MCGKAYKINRVIEETPRVRVPGVFFCTYRVHIKKKEINSKGQIKMHGKSKKRIKNSKIRVAIDKM